MLLPRICQPLIGGSRHLQRLSNLSHLSNQSKLSISLPSRRQLSTETLTKVKTLWKDVPVIGAHAKDIEILENPTDFLMALKQGITMAKSRIIMASLYLGTGTHERDLLNTIRESMDSNPNKKSLQIHFLLDALRGSRGPISSRSMLTPLLEEYPENMKVSLFHTNLLGGLVKKLVPARFNEAFGLFHMKAYVFDNDVILSGANLSDSYFVDRQDRYVHFKNNSELANYFARLTGVVGEVSYELTSKNLLVSATQGFPDPVTQTSSFKQKAGDKLRHFLENEVKLSETFKAQATENMGSFDTAVVPLVQAGSLDVNQDNNFTYRFLEAFDSPLHTYHLASGYFNLTPDYMNRIATSSSVFKILTAAPQANGFYGSKGVSQFVPDGYTCMERKFLKDLSGKGRDEVVSIFEYYRPGWTFHVKGLWFSESPQKLPCMTFVGSPNYGQRSATRDIEAQVLVVTSDTDLQQRLAKERDHLYENAQQIERDDLETDDRKTPMYLRFFAWILMPFF